MQRKRCCKWLCKGTFELVDVGHRTPIHFTLKCGCPLSIIKNSIREPYYWLLFKWNYCHSYSLYYWSQEKGAYYIFFGENKQNKQFFWSNYFDTLLVPFIEKYRGILKYSLLKGHSSLPTSKNREEATLEENELFEQTEGTLYGAGIAD